MTVPPTSPRSTQSWSVPAPAPGAPPGPPRPRPARPANAGRPVKGQGKPKPKGGKGVRSRTTVAPKGSSAAVATRRPGSPSHSSSGQRRRRAQRKRGNSEWSKVAPVYDVEGPRVRLGVAWFAAVLPAVLISPLTAGVAYAVAGGLAARQTVQAWRGVQWQADLAAGLAAVPVLAAVLGTGPLVAALAGVAAVALVAGAQAPLDSLRGGAGRAAAAGVLVQATLPVAVAGAAVVLVRNESAAAAFLLVGLASAYEMGDFLVGSAASNPIEGPLAGGAAVILAGFPMALLLVEPFDVMGATILGVAALCCPVGQWIASAVLPRPGASAPALRRIDTLLLLAPVWAIGAGVFVA